MTHSQQQQQQQASNVEHGHSMRSYQALPHPNPVQNQVSRSEISSSSETHQQQQQQQQHYSSVQTNTAKLSYPSRSTITASEATAYRMSPLDVRFASVNHQNMTTQQPYSLPQNPHVFQANLHQVQDNERHLQAAHFRPEHLNPVHGSHLLIHQDQLQHVPPESRHPDLTNVLLELQQLRLWRVQAEEQLKTITTSFLSVTNKLDTILGLIQQQQQSQLPDYQPTVFYSSPPGGQQQLQYQYQQPVQHNLQGGHGQLHTNHSTVSVSSLDSLSQPPLPLPLPQQPQQQSQPQPQPPQAQSLSEQQQQPVTI